MFQKIARVVKKRGLLMAFSMEGDVMNISIIPKSMSEDLVPVVVSCTVENASEIVEKALDEIIGADVPLMQSEAFIQSVKKSSEKPKKPGKPEKKDDSPDMFAGAKEEVVAEETNDDGDDDIVEDVDAPEECEECTVPTPEPAVVPEKKPVAEKKPKEVVVPPDDEDLF